MSSAHQTGQLGRRAKNGGGMHCSPAAARAANTTAASGSHFLTPLLLKDLGEEAIPWVGLMCVPCCGCRRPGWWAKGKESRPPLRFTAGMIGMLVILELSAGSAQAGGFVGWCTQTAGVPLQAGHASCTPFPTRTAPLDQASGRSGRYKI
jgi:hypothetical protein